MSTTLDGAPLTVGMLIDAKFRGTAFRPGHVTNVRPDGTCDIAYVDGDMVRTRAIHNDPFNRLWGQGVVRFPPSWVASDIRGAAK
jgi:hypothetical protein